MKKRGMIWAIGMMTVLVLGQVSCKQKGLSDSIEPITRYLNQMIHNGDTGVPISQPLSFYLGKALDPFSVNTGTITLQLASGPVVNGDV